MIGAPAVYSFEGGTPGSARQNRPHLHCIYASINEKFLYANDLGTDRIYKFEIKSGASGIKTLQEGQPPFFALPAGEGPRHAVFHPNGKYAYLISELSGRVAVLKYENGDFTPVQYIEADTLHAAGSADIHVTPDGRFLYASNRLKGDGLAIFSINPKSGQLTKTGYQPTGINPRNFIITPDGKYLLCACRDTNNIQVFAIDPKSGLLTNLQKDIEVHQPVCLKFARME
jgi:6-phosphogluconolactonase (cycloisomerase 2 family)